MARGLHQLKPRLLPSLRQTPRRGGRADHILPPLHDIRADMRNKVLIAQDLALVDKAVMREIVVLQPRESTRVIGRRLAQGEIGIHRGQRILPIRPSPPIARLGRVMAAEQALMIGRDQILVLGLGDHIGEPRPKIGKEPRGPPAIEPIQLGLLGQKHPAQHQMQHPRGMRLCIEQRQGRAPTAAETDPALNPQHRADPLHIGNQIFGGIGLDARIGPRKPAAALIEQHDPVESGVKIPTHRRAASAPRPAMAHHHRNPVRVARLLHVNLMPVAHIKQPLIETINRRIKKGAGCALLPCGSVHERTI